MTTIKRPAGEGTPQTGFISSQASNDKPNQSRLKALIVRLALWGQLPIRTADRPLLRLSGGRL